MKLFSDIFKNISRVIMSVSTGYDAVMNITSHDLVYECTEKDFIDSKPCNTMRVCFICFYVKEVGIPNGGAMFTCNKCFQARKKTFTSIKDLGDLRDSGYLGDKVKLVESFSYID